eukprot:scaffold3747_cov99-Cylindrotheca_fusiformis.AAC.3
MNRTTTVNACVRDSSSAKQECFDKKTLEDGKKLKETIWSTNGGAFRTRYECPLTFTLPNFTSSREVTWNMRVDEEGSSWYDMIIGRDMLRALKFDILFSTGHLRWEGLSIPMQSAMEMENRTAYLDATYDELDPELSNAFSAQHMTFQLMFKNYCATVETLSRAEIVHMC